MNGLKALLDLTLLQAKPQDIRYSPALLGIAVAVSVGGYILLVQPFAAMLNEALGREVDLLQLAVAEHACLAVAVWGLLRFKRKPERFVQTITAVFGANAIVQLVMWPVTDWLIRVRDSAAASTPTVLLIGLRIWLLIVFAHIFKEALDVGMGTGILYALGCWLLALFLLRMLLSVIG